MNDTEVTGQFAAGDRTRLGPAVRSRRGSQLLVVDISHPDRIYSCIFFRHVHECGTPTLRSYRSWEQCCPFERGPCAFWAAFWVAFWLACPRLLCASDHDDDLPFSTVPRHDSVVGRLQRRVHRPVSVRVIRSTRPLFRTVRMVRMVVIGCDCFLRFVRLPTDKLPPTLDGH